MFPETIEYITLGCRFLAGNECTNRRNTLSKIVHQAIAIQYQLQKDWQPYYTYSPHTILENAKYKLYWNRTIHTGKTLMHNRPDITQLFKTDTTLWISDGGHIVAVFKWLTVVNKIIFSYWVFSPVTLFSIHLHKGTEI